MGYCFVSDVQRKLQKTFTTTSVPTADDVQEFIEDASADVDSLTGKTWGRFNIVDEYHDGVDWGPNASTIFLEHSPVLTVTKVEYWNGGEWKDNTEEAPLGGETPGSGNFTYSVYYNQGIIRLNKLMINGNKVFRVTYSYGESALPRDLAMACADLAALHVLTAISGGAQTKYNTNGVQIQYADGWAYGRQATMLQQDFNRKIGRLREFVCCVGPEVG